MPASLTVAEVATRYGVSAHTALKWIGTAELRAINVGRTRNAKRPSWRIPPEALQAFEAGRAPQQQPATKARRRKPAGEVIEFY